MKVSILLDKIFEEKNHRKIVIFLFVIAVLVRVIGISTFPAGINQDEASTGYDAFSIIKTGHDRMGNTYPVQLEGWGNGQYALYNYLSQPFISFFGLNTFSVRIVNAIASILTLLIFYFLFQKYFDKNKALLALFFLAINPWSIMASRWGFDGNLFPVTLLIGVFFLIKAIENTPKFFPLAFFFFALCLYTYATSYIYIPLFLCFLLFYLYKQKLLNFKYSVISIAVFFIFALPMILNVLINYFDLKEINFYNITIPKLNDSRTTQIFNLISPNFALDLTKNIIRFSIVIFLQSDGLIYNAIPTFGYSYLVSLPFFIVGLFSVFRNKSYKINNLHSIFLLWLISAFIFGCTIQVNINRINIVFFPIIYFTIIGFIETEKWIVKENKIVFRRILLSVYILFFLFFTGYYFTFFNEQIKSNFSYGLGEAIQYADKINTKGTIHVTDRTVNMPYIYVCFYNQMDPNFFLSSAIFNINRESGFNNVSQFGKYTFGENHQKTDSVSIIGIDEFEYNKKQIVDYKKFGNYYVLKSKRPKYTH